MFILPRIPEVGTAALGAVGLMFPTDRNHHCLRKPLWKWRCTAVFYLQRKKTGKLCRTDHGYLFLHALHLRCFPDARSALLFARPILTVFGASQNALTYAYSYMMIYLIGTIPSMISIGMNPFINAQGYSTIGMLSVAIGAVANLLLDPLFIFVLGFGVQGAAIATISISVFIRGICFILP